MSFILDDTCSSFPNLNHLSFSNFCICSNLSYEYFLQLKIFRVKTVSLTPPTFLHSFALNDTIFSLLAIPFMPQIVLLPRTANSFLFLLVFVVVLFWGKTQYVAKVDLKLLIFPLPAWYWD